MDPYRMTRFDAKLALKQNSLFRQLPEATIEKIAALAHDGPRKKGQEIFRQGDPGDALYSVVSGQVRISTIGLDGDDLSLNIMEPGEVFGEIAILDGRPRTASARMLTDGLLLKIERSAFLKLLQSDPEISIHMFLLLCKRLRYSTELAEDSAFLSGPARLAKRLIEMAEKHAGSASDPDIELAVSQSQLATMVGVSRQMINRYLSPWKNDRWLDLSRNKIVIRKLDELKRFVDNQGTEQR